MNFRTASTALAVLIFAAPGQALVMPDRVYGQPNLNVVISNNPDLPPNGRMVSPRGVAVTEEGVYISDEMLNRVLFMPGGSILASRVYGQPDYSSTFYNHYGLNASSLSRPAEVEANDSGVIIADWRNSRALFYRHGETTASRVFGQPGFGSSCPQWDGISPNSLTYPENVSLDANGGAYVTDSFICRVLYYPPGSSWATRVYGAETLYSMFTGSNEKWMNSAAGTAVSADGVYIADRANHRVLFYPHGSQSATRVYGQPNFTAHVVNNGGISANSLYYPTDVALDKDGVYISDTYNKRVLFYPGTSTTATIVYGQPSLNTVVNSSAPGDGILSDARAIAVDEFAVYVVETYRARVVRYPKVGVNVPRSFEFTGQPGTAKAGESLSESPLVVVRKADGTIASDFNGFVRVKLASGVGPSCAKLLGTTKFPVINGVAVLDDVRVDTPGTYKLTASVGTLTEHDSAEFTITAPDHAFNPADADHSGSVTITDAVLLLRAFAGLDGLTNG